MVYLSTGGRCISREGRQPTLIVNCEVMLGTCGCPLDKKEHKSRVSILNYHGMPKTMIK